MRLFVRRGEAAARLAGPSARRRPSRGKLSAAVIDYALAGGLAHEAFGHAAEADWLSFLGPGSRREVPHGERGEPSTSRSWTNRSRAITLAVHSATMASRASGRRSSIIVVSPTGCPTWGRPAGRPSGSPARRERSLSPGPAPRMSNIRIEVDRPLPAPGSSRIRAARGAGSAGSPGSEAPPPDRLSLGFIAGGA